MFKILKLFSPHTTVRYRFLCSASTTAVRLRRRSSAGRQYDSEPPASPPCYLVAGGIVILLVVLCHAQLLARSGAQYILHRPLLAGLLFSNKHIAPLAASSLPVVGGDTFLY